MMAGVPTACVVSSPTLPSDAWLSRLPARHRQAAHRLTVQLGRQARFEVRALATACGGTLPPRALDLLELGAAVFLADQLVRRPAGVAGTRHIALHLQVREPAALEPARNDLETALMFLSRDRWTLAFHPRRPDAGWDARLRGENGRRLAGMEGVALFSGGLDSLAGALQLHQQGVRPLLLAHSRNWKSRQQRVHDAIAGVTGQPLLQFDVGLQSRGLPAAERLTRIETSQRARAFLYLTAAAAVAVGWGLTRIWLCENGPLACAVPAQPHLIPTRHAHPHFLSLVERAFARILGGPLTIENPFLWMTKGQEIAAVGETLRSNRLGDALRETVSCWQFFSLLLGIKPPNLACGACVPCLVRRAALNHAGFAGMDAPVWVRLEESVGAAASSFERLGLSPAKAQQGEARIRRAWLALHRFAARLDGLGDEDFFQLPEASELLRQPGAREVATDWRCRVPRLHRDFAAEFRATFPL